jgi:SSS family solute:Na+ symporter
MATELVSRVIAARSPAVARNGAFAAGFIYIAVGAVAITIGLAGERVVGTLLDAEQVIPTAAHRLLSPGLYIVFAGGFLSAILSTVDSTLLVSAGLFSHNLLLPVLGTRNERTKVRVTRLAVATFGLIAYVLARRAEGVFALVETASAFGSAGTLVTILFALFTRFGGIWAALSTLVMGIVSYAAATALGWPVPFLISLGASLITYLAVGVTERGKAHTLNH